MPKALENIKVLDFTRMYAGPFCTMLLCDLGAEVFKVEIPGGGDAVRNIPPFTEGGESAYFINLNRGKKSFTLNLQAERGREICKELVKKVDIVVENFTPRVMDNLGLGYEELSKINPRLIYAASSGFGHSGPRRDFPAYDLIAQAMGGMLSISGFPDGPPEKAGGTATADFVGGMYNTIAILGALHYREQTGEGQSIDISMQDCVWSFVGVSHAPFYFMTGEAPPRLGNGYIEGVPLTVYPAKDGYIIIAGITVGQWENLLKVIGREDLIGDERYTTQAVRIERREETDAMVTKWTKPRSIEEITNLMAKAHLPCAPVPSLAEVAHDPQLLERGMITEVEQLLSGTVKTNGSVLKLSKTPGVVDSPAPFLGQHNDAVYSDILGYSEEKISELATDGII